MRITCVLIAFLLSYSGCKKSDFLDARPQSNTYVPKTFSDLQSMLDNTLNGPAGMNISTALDCVSGDILQIPDATFGSVPDIQRNAYAWEKDLYAGTGMLNDWNIPFNQIYKANLTLEALNSISDTNSQARNYLKGQAFFFRAYACFSLAQVFIPYYDSSTANADMGLPIRLEANINHLAQRSSVKATFDQILADLASCREIMNVSSPGTIKNRPTRASLFALLARIHLYLRSYNLANAYADSSLNYYNKLIDYFNPSISQTSNSPFPIANDESIFYSISTFNYVTIGAGSVTATIDPTLYASYDNNDLRKVLYFRTPTGGIISRKSDYSQGINVFTGLATDELYLIKAECLARLGNIAGSMQWLNNLIRTRYKKVGPVTTYIDQVATTSQQALSKVLIERKKELLYRQRWGDLRRLNKEGAGITITRVINGQTYTLPPNSPLYVLPIPPDEIAMSGIQQNPR